MPLGMVFQKKLQWRYCNDVKWEIRCNMSPLLEFIIIFDLVMFGVWLLYDMYRDKK